MARYARCNGTLVTCATSAHTIHRQHRHFGWDNAIPPVLRVAAGTTVSVDCLDAANGQLTPTSTVADVARLDPAQVNPVTGPIHVDGAEPGDALKITVEALAPSGFVWTANIPGFGLLAEQFLEPALHLWDCASNLRHLALFGSHARVPLKPLPARCAVHPPNRYA